MTPGQLAAMAASPQRSDRRPTTRDDVRLRKRRRAVMESLAAPGLGVALLLTWQVSVTVLNVSEFVLPTPVAVIGRIITDFPLLLKHTWVTATEVVVGFGAAAILGIAIALSVFYSRLFERAVYPLLIAMQTIPKVALAPLVVLYLGYDWGPKFFLSFLIAFFPVVVATVVGLKSLDQGFVNLARSMGATEAQLFLKIRLPAALPSMFGGFKVALSLAVIGAVIGEYIAAERGLGYLQLQANASFDTTLNFAAVVMIAALGLGLYAVVVFAEKRFG